MKMVKFPKVIRVGQAKATIYKTPAHRREIFTMAWNDGPTRKRKVFNELHLAETHAITKATSQANASSIFSICPMKNAWPVDGLRGGTFRAAGFPAIRQRADRPENRAGSLIDQHRYPSPLP
jgi:hypothetical protein